MLAANLTNRRAMPPARLVKTGFVWSLYVAICGGAAVMVATWIPWLGCKPLSALPDEAVEITQIPSDALCYSVDQGRLDFRGHEAVAENPAPFVLMVALSAMLIALALWPRLWNGLRSWARGRRRF